MGNEEWGNKIKAALEKNHSDNLLSQIWVSKKIPQSVFCGIFTSKSLFMAWERVLIMRVWEYWLEPGLRC